MSPPGPVAPACSAEPECCCTRSNLAAIALIVLVTFVAFAPILKNGFVYWDDDVNLLNNPAYRGEWPDTKFWIATASTTWESVKAHLVAVKHTVEWMFHTTHTGAYQPLTWATLAVDYMIWGHQRPYGYHLTSLLIHIGAAVVLFLVSLRLLRLALNVSEGRHEPALVLGAAVAALLFAIHPLRVESVAWATERRDVLSGLFFFLAILSYLRVRTPASGGAEPKVNFFAWAFVLLVLTILARGTSNVLVGLFAVLAAVMGVRGLVSKDTGLEPKGRSLGWAFAFFTMAMLSKGTTLVLPLVLLVLDFYPLRRLRGGVRGWVTGSAREVWFEKAPFLAAAVFLGVVAVRGQQQAGALAGLAERDIADRIAVAFYGPALYLFKTFVPVGLSPLYEWPLQFSPVGVSFLLSGVVVIALTVLVIRFHPYWPAGVALWVVYLVVLAPVLVPFQIGTHLAADRCTYLACVVWALLVGAGVAYCWLRKGGVAGLGAGFLAALLIVALAGRTWQYTHVWRDTRSLWGRVLAVNPNSWHALAGLGSEWRRQAELERDPKKRQKDYDEAIAYYQRAMDINRESADLQNNYGSILMSLGKTADALKCYREAVKLNPRLAAAQYNLATALVKMDREDEAIDFFLKAIELAPQFSDAHYNLANVYARMGNDLEAERHYTLAIRSDPFNRKAAENLKVIQNRRLRAPK